MTYCRPTDPLPLQELQEAARNRVVWEVPLDADRTRPNFRSQAEPAFLFQKGRLNVYEFKESGLGHKGLGN